MKSGLADLVIQAEEHNGDILSNRIRYAMNFFFAISAIISSANREDFLIFNLVIASAYLALTIVQSIILTKNNRSLARLFSIISFFADFALFAGMLIYYYLLLSPDNAAFLFKNQLIFLLIIPSVFVALQFRPGLLLFGLCFTLFAMVGMMLYGMTNGMMLTDNWKEHVLGSALLPGASFSILPAFFIAVGAGFFFIVFRSRRMIRRLGQLEASKASLSRYFSPAVAEEILRNPDQVSNGRVQKVTILFSDIRNFTSMSEKMDPVQMVARLSRYREQMLKLVFAHNGTLDKFIGDAVMATFGTPLASPIEGQDSRNALACAQGMLESLEEWNRTEGLSGDDAWKIGIGIHTGMVIAGNVGSKDFLEYTVIGDAVNTASRIESLCKDYSASLLVSAEVMQDLGQLNDNQTEIGQVKVKGRTETVGIYRFV